MNNAAHNAIVSRSMDMLRNGVPVHIISQREQMEVAQQTPFGEGKVYLYFRRLDGKLITRYPASMEKSPSQNTENAWQWFSTNYPNISPERAQLCFE